MEKKIFLVGDKTNRRNPSLNRGGRVYAIAFRSHTKQSKHLALENFITIYTHEPDDDANE